MHELLVTGVRIFHPRAAPRGNNSVAFNTLVGVVCGHRSRHYCVLVPPPRRLLLYLLNVAEVQGGRGKLAGGNPVRKPPASVVG